MAGAFAGAVAVGSTALPPTFGALVHALFGMGGFAFAFAAADLAAACALIMPASVSAVDDNRATETVTAGVCATDNGTGLAEAGGEFKTIDARNTDMGDRAITLGAS